MKRKIILIAILAISLLLISIGGIYAYHSSNNNTEKDLPNPTKKKQKVDEKVKLSKDKVELDKDSSMAKQLEILNTYGEKMYDSREYESFRKKKEMYFISLNELQAKYGYDISVFKGEDGKQCNLEESGIYFDIDNTMHIDLSNGFKPVLSTLVECTYAETSKKMVNQ